MDPSTDSFWHANEYGQRNDKSAGWGTFLCEFSILGGSCIPTEETELSCSDGLDNDCDGLIDAADPDCDGGSCTLGQKGDSCSDGSECCSGKCTGKPGAKVCK